MLKRNVTAIILIAIALVFLLYLRTFYVFLADVLFLVAAIMGGAEMCAVGKKCGFHPIIPSVVVFAITMYPAFFFLEMSGVTAAFALSCVCALLLFVAKRKVYALQDLTYTFTVLVYPMFICTLFFYINGINGNLLAIFYILFVTLLSDAFALFAGMLFGRRKLCEDVSPKKTVAGAVGAYVGGMLGATAVLLMFDVFHIFDSWKNVGLTSLFSSLWASVPVYLGLSLICTTAAIYGDLAASWIKRQVGIKDFGKIFPGHGGVMDRLDSLLFVTPVVYLFFVIYGAVV